MSCNSLAIAKSRVPAGAWAVGVSGGADSVAILALLRQRTNLRLHVVHLNHETRGADSDADAEFVAALAKQWGLSVTVALRSQIERDLTGLPANPSARYRLVRMELFRKVVVEHGLLGVILAHHADDQAETVLHRLLRGSGPAGLAAMKSQTTFGGLTILRPLLGVRRDALRLFLQSMHQPWREDASNAEDVYFRNRLRKLLAEQPNITADLLKIAAEFRLLRDWVQNQAPVLEPSFDLTRLQTLPHALAAESARRWLLERGVPPDELTPPVVDRLLTMSRDAASPPRQHFPGGVLVRRRQGRVGI